jgi:tetratricopeptide (TPR) repeat protein
MQYEVVGRLDQAQALTEEALAQLEPIAATHALEIISVRTTLAKLAGLRGDFPDMQRRYREILDARRALLGPDHARLAVDWNNLAAVALQRDSYAEAAEAYREAMRLLGNDPKSPESRQAWLRTGLGAALTGLGDYAGAQVEFDAGLEIAERTLHPAHPIIGAVRMGRSLLARYQSRWPLAEREATLAVDLFAPINHPDQGVAEVLLGLALLAAGDDARARDRLQDAERHIAARRNREDPRYWQSRAALALVGLRLGHDGAAAETEIRAALDQIERDPRRDGVIHAEMLLFAAEVAARRGSAGEAQALHLRALAMLERSLGSAHPRLSALRHPARAPP